MLRRAALLLAVLTGLSLFASPAEARVAAQVSIHDFSFDPATVTVAQGGTVTWTNNQSSVHTVTSNQGFWDSGDLSFGDTYSQSAAFRNAGSYGYFCMHHPTLMKGTVRVRLKASGSPSNGWTVRWSSASSTPANRDFDVQIKRPGSTSFVSFRSTTTALTAPFDPAKAGKYKFQARTRITSSGKVSDWSPVKTLTIS
jgi:plastocyanin